jgi:hypothetical protein
MQIVPHVYASLGVIEIDALDELAGWLDERTPAMEPTNQTRPGRERATSRLDFETIRREK